MASRAPTGTVTFLFTDMEGSTRLLERHPDAYPGALSRHHAILRGAVESLGGIVFETVGDAMYAAFSRPTCAVAAALRAQLELVREPWGAIGRLKVRMGLHTGEVDWWGDRYFGAPLHRCARLTAIAHGGQVLLSAAAAELVCDGLPEGASLRALGEHQLRDLGRPERVFQLSHPDLAADFPPLRTLQSRPNNLPPQTTPFIGREREVDTLRHRFLRRPDVRLLTLLGPGGTGKTRLALQVALDSLDDFPDGAFFIPLSRISDPSLVPSALAQALGVREAAERPLVESLKNYLRDRRLLLLLDNFEQVIEAAPLVADLLAACPHVKILVTSREALRLYGERQFPVPPLTLPDPKRLPPPEQLAQFEAVRLFVERAQDITPNFAIDDENARAVAEICHRLDGLPLAIELAAARTRSLTPPAMLARLEHRLPLLTGGARDLPARQQTLRNAIAWSYDLLDVAEQALFRQLAVFAGGCTLEAVEAVCDPPGDPAADLLDGLESLVSKSLLEHERPAAASAARGAGDGGRPGGGVAARGPRLVMLQTIREYGLERLSAAGEAGRVRRRHAAYYVTLAAEAAPELRGPHQVAWLDRLDEERHNFRAALRWAIEGGEIEQGLHLAGCLWFYWYVRGYLREGREWLATLLALPGAAARTAARAKALAGLGVLTWHLGDFAAARPLLEESVAIARELGDPRDLASSLAWFGHILQQEDPAAARQMLEQALAIGRELDDRALVVRALNTLGERARRDGDYTRAAALYEEGLVLARELGHQWRIAAALHNLGHVAQRSGGAERAAACFQESLAIMHALGDQRGIAHCLAGLAGVAATEGQAERAARLFGAAEALLDASSLTLDPADRQEYERNVAILHRAPEGSAYAAAWAEGRRLPLDQALQYAREGAPG